MEQGSDWIPYKGHYFLFQCLQGQKCHVCVSLKSTIMYVQTGTISHMCVLYVIQVMRTQAFDFKPRSLPCVTLMRACVFCVLNVHIGIFLKTVAVFRHCMRINCFLEHVSPLPIILCGLVLL